ncbi:hypothetical protein HYH03_006164 [Edaphochlamys debaryana]|uniref:non-specific serine/threonine protein kinase n=1 Tax=Edaphochlamys debaryana TaxID=47281 RepID=A0A836C1I4_9CHLO|nr:hypothetical protein HYH03_006164 [Edaphochlamys debaryana]|eukprot:KAG2495564.1 hypothetical protein HYH03_006164 [Edaphochlamys debaryana]
MAAGSGAGPALSGTLNSGMSATPAPSGPRDPNGRYARYELIGQGAQKKVYRAFDEDRGMEVAWNEVMVAEMARFREKDRQRVFAEIRVLKQLKHKNIMTLYDSWFDEKRLVLCFITEIFPDGTLRQYRRRHKTADVPAIKRWAWQILQGLVYLHGHNPPIIHRDLKCDNIFVSGASGTVKIGDLGLVTLCKDLSAPQSVLGTPEFMAPELYEEKYDEKVDVYAYGMCLLELATMDYPYSECKNAAQIYKKVTQGIPPACLERIASAEMREFIQLCIQPDPHQRPEGRQLLKHPFFESIRAQAVAANQAGGSGHKLAISPSMSMNALQAEAVAASAAASAAATAANAAAAFSESGEQQQLSSAPLSRATSSSFGAGSGGGAGALGGVNRHSDSGVVPGTGTLAAALGGGGALGAGSIAAAAGGSVGGGMGSIAAAAGGSAASVGGLVAMLGRPASFPSSAAAAPVADVAPAPPAMGGIAAALMGGDAVIGQSGLASGPALGSIASSVSPLGTPPGALAAALGSAVGLGPIASAASSYTSAASVSIGGGAGHLPSSALTAALHRQLSPKSSGGGAPEGGSASPPHTLGSPEPPADSLLAAPAREESEQQRPQPSGGSHGCCGGGFVLPSIDEDHELDEDMLFDDHGNRHLTIADDSDGEGGCSDSSAGASPALGTVSAIALEGGCSPGCSPGAGHGPGSATRSVPVSLRLNTPGDRAAANLAVSFAMSFTNQRGVRKKVGFQYDLVNDTASALAAEMVENLSLNTAEAATIAAMIQHEVSRFGRLPQDQAGHAGQGQAQGHGQ